MKGEGPSDELQEVEEELVMKKGEGHEEDDPVELDLEKQESVSKKGKGAVKVGTENLKVFTQVVESFMLASL